MAGLTSPPVPPPALAPGAREQARWLSLALGGLRSLILTGVAQASATLFPTEPLAVAIERGLLIAILAGYLVVLLANRQARTSFVEQLRRTLRPSV